MIIENCIIKSAGVLIFSTKTGANVTIRNTAGYALTPTTANGYPGEFLFIENFANLVIENNYMEGTSGMDLRFYKGNPSQGHTIKVRYNKAKNIDGRRVDGSKPPLIQFCQLNAVQNVPGIEIAWNEIINEPGKSAVEDNINIYRSSGTSDNPLIIHNNYIQGAYPANVQATSYSGGGILLADGSGPTAADVSRYVRAYNNQVISTTNYGIAIAGGNNNAFYNNRIISSGYLADGTYLPAQNVGMYVWNLHKDSSIVFFNNSAYNNTSGWVKQSNANGRNDWWLPHCTNCTGNTSIPGAITYQMELDEYTAWQQKLQANSITVGVKPISTAVRTEAETNFVKVTDTDGDIATFSCSGGTLSNGKAVSLYDVTDKVRINFSVAESANYRIAIRVRSGDTSSPTTFWPNGYAFTVNNTAQTLTGDASSVSAQAVCIGTSYWGTMRSAEVSLSAGQHFITVEAKGQWCAVDFVEVTKVVPTLLEAEFNFTKVTDTDGDITTISCTGGILSNDKGVSLYDVGDKIRINFSITQTGSYQVWVRLRSGYSGVPTSYWPNGYAFTIDDATQTFTGDATSVSALNGCIGNSYWGTMRSGALNLGAGAHSVTIEAKAQWGAVDYVEIRSTTGARLASQEVLMESPLLVYPNPFQDQLTVDVAGLPRGTYNFSVIDVLGKTHYSKEHTLLAGQSNVTLSLPGREAQPGLYLLKVGQGVDSNKIVRLLKQ